MSREVHGACPLNCPDGCAWTVTVDDAGSAIKLRGRKDHPFTRGSLCVKVNSYLDYVARPDRLMHPLRRVGPKGAGVFERISWDEALGEVAERTQGVIEEFGGTAVWPFTGTGTVGWLQGHGAGRRLWRSLGASFHVINICSVAGHAGMSFTTGSAAGLDPEDMRHSRLILLWGANVLTSNQHLWPFIAEARAKGAHVVTIDPVRTRTAMRSDEHMAPIPGTDGALALGLMSEVVRSGGADTDWLTVHTDGWEEFRSSLRDWSAERASEVSGVDAPQIRSLARRIASTRPLSIRLSMGMQRHAGGGQAARVISCLPAVTGDYGRLGGGAVYSTSPFYGLNVGALYGFDTEPRPSRVLQMSQLADVLDDTEDPVKALFVHAANPAVSNPDQKRVLAHLEREDLFITVLDAFHSDTSRFADIVLPSTLQVEHRDVNDSFSHAYLHWNEPAVDPPGECLAPTEVMRRLASAFGLEDPRLFASDDELAAALLTSSSPTMDGIDFDELRRVGYQRLNVASGVAPFADKFPTGSGRFTFASQRAEQLGHGRLPNYRPPAEAASSGGLALLAPADHHFLNSQFADSSTHMAKAGPLVVHMHPLDAKEVGVLDGDLVLVGNERGQFEATARVDETARPGVLAATKGRPGTGVNQVTNASAADMADGAIFHDALVEVTRAVDASPLVD